jgi:hypothetical protein
VKLVFLLPQFNNSCSHTNKILKKHTPQTHRSSHDSQNFVMGINLL